MRAEDCGRRPNSITAVHAAASAALPAATPSPCSKLGINIHAHQQAAVLVLAKRSDRCCAAAAPLIRCTYQGGMEVKSKICTQVPQGPLTCAR
jgi:hypothetical protein